MDLQAAGAKDGAHWAWARTGALVLFLLTAILLISTLSSAHSAPNARAQLDGTLSSQSQPLPRS